MGRYRTGQFVTIADCASDVPEAVAANGVAKISGTITMRSAERLQTTIIGITTRRECVTDVFFLNPKTHRRRGDRTEIRSFDQAEPELS